MLSFKRFIVREAFNRFLLGEGGNIKVKTASGEVSAAPFEVKNRSEQAKHVREALSQMHNEFNQEHGEHLFGNGGSGLASGSIFAGSTRHFMSKEVPDEQFKQHKPSVGDFDIQVSRENKGKLDSFLFAGRKFGKYTVVGTKKHGTEISAVMRHENGQHHQFDFEGVETDQKTGEPTKAEQFLHSANWEDTKQGIKGMHHKILLNAVAGDTRKFSITHGLRSRTDDADPGLKNPTDISQALFGKGADHSKINSFMGVSELIKRHIPKQEHQKIYDKFRDSLLKQKGDHTAALTHLSKTLGLNQNINEEVEEHHTSVIPMVGFSPISHMGHSTDLGGALRKLPGTKHVGISSKADLFSPEERKGIMDRQWGNVGHTTHVVSGAGETIRKAYDSLPSRGRKVLHILLGADRQGMAEGLKASLEAGKIKEMGDLKFDEIRIHTPEDQDRSHGMSGTKMRQAAVNGNQEEFHRHLGPMFTKKESNGIMARVQSGIQSGKIKLKR